MGARRQIIYPEIAKYMAIKRVTQKDLAEAIGLSQQSLSLKLIGKADFKRSEMVAIRNYFRDSNPEITMDKLFHIFLGA